MIDILEARDVPSFTAPVSYNVGTQSDGFVPNAAPINVVTGDFNGDGKLDLIVSHKVDNSVYFLAGIGNGTFQPAVKWSVGESIEGREFAGDFNGDGKLDLFLPGDLNSANHPIILLGNGNGTFQPRIDSSSFSVPGSYPRGWAVGDFNGDGKLDVECTLPNGADSGAYMVLLGNGDGTFQPGIVGPTVLHYSRWSTTGDFNGDGKLDLAIADGQGAGSQTGTAELTILLGNGDGTFTLGGHYASPGTPGADTLNPEGVVTADLNHDGKLDVIVADYDQNISVFMGNGDGTFQPAMGYTTGEYPRAMNIADVNGDGNVDLVVNNLGVGPGGAEFQKEGALPGTVAVMLGNGDGTFQAPIQYSPSAFYPGWTVTGDFNGDGLPDIAATQVSNGHSVNVMLNIPLSTNLPPTVATDASATPSPVTGTTTNLSVLGADDGGEANLTYTWAFTNTSAAPVTFSTNGTNAAKNTTATFTKAGTYNIYATITDASGLSIISSVTVTVNLTLTSITVAPASASVAANGTHQFTATGKDQFGAALATQPTFTWMVSVGGAISNTGLFTAGSTAGGPFIITAASSGKSGTASVTVTSSSGNAPPTVATAATANPNPVAATTTALSVLGADDGGEANLTYTWTVGGPAGVTVSANGTNAAKNDTATFTRAGTYNFLATITDSGGLSTTSPVTVIVNQTLTSITVAPASASVPTNGTQQFTATAGDQFGNALNTQPTMTWTVSGGGAINSSGLFTAGASAGGPFTITATSGTISGTASVTVTAALFPTWTGLGTTSNWSDAANWSTNAAPTAGATVTFNGTSTKNAIVDSGFAGTVAAVQISSGYTGTVSLSRNLTITGAFTAGAGNFSAGANTLFVAGNFTESGGTFDAGAGTVTFNGTTANQNLSSAGVNFYNVTLANSGHSLNITGTLTVTGTFTWLRTAGYIVGPNGSGNASIECKGDVDNQNHGGTGNPYFTLDGTGDQAIKDTSGVLNYSGFAGGDFRGLTINKQSGTVVLQCDPLIYNGLSLLQGTVNSSYNGGTYWWFVGNTGNSSNIISTASGLNLGNVTLAGNIGTALSTGLQVANLTFSGHSLTAPAALYVSGNWAAGGSGSSFTANSGTVYFDGASGTQTLDSGGSNFYNITHSGTGTLQLINNNLTVNGAFINSGGTFDTNGKAVTYAVPPPRVTASSISGTVSGPVSSVRLTFNTSIDPTTFTLADISFTGPGGVVIPVSAVTPVAGSNNTQFDISFAPQSALGTYTMVIGPDIRNTRGTPMDQNNNSVPGETPADQFTLNFTIA